MLDKAIEHCKEHRKPYHGAKACDKTCTNHGSCYWCKNDRTISSKKLDEKIKFDLKTQE